jgi:hypothetical protein
VCDHRSEFFRILSQSTLLSQILPSGQSATDPGKVAMLKAEMAPGNRVAADSEAFEWDGTSELAR